MVCSSYRFILQVNLHPKSPKAIFMGKTHGQSQKEAAASEVLSSL